LVPHDRPSSAIDTKLTVPTLRLVTRVLGLTHPGRRELPDGYAFQMDTKQIDTGQLVEWIELERRCCPFFGFEVLWDRKNGPVWLHLTGPEGVKDFILGEFGLR
jgi:hypothetical protein